ncbi:MAG: gluconate 2-dehydrogenase subunit 3 family protein [Actinobacteria bacterium]|nr:gluconate 2-dehydrogenase subunit 3 family protein [Actinomycetota bacterium]
MSEFGRRAFLRGTGTFALLGLVSPKRLAQLAAAPTAAGQQGHFLTAHELATLRAVTDRFLPGPPEDDHPGALDAHCAEAIDLLLGAFTFVPPLIHAGGPFSGRAGGSHDDFADFVPLDAHAELGWRIRIEGSRGRKEREFGGRVVGLQQEYRDGLAHLDGRATALGAADFASLPAPLQVVVLSDQTDDAVQSFVGTALSHTIDAMYGPPEYGGNQGLVGWSQIGWQGDTQPRGFSVAQVTTSGGAATLTTQRTAARQAFDKFLVR